MLTACDKQGPPPEQDKPAESVSDAQPPSDEPKKPFGELHIIDKGDPSDQLATLSVHCDEAALKEQQFHESGRSIKVFEQREQDLYFEIGHGGGCKDHQYVVCWDGAIAKSEPGQVTLKVWHRHNDDTCEAFITKPIQLKPEQLDGLQVRIANSPTELFVYNAK
jgi:hypothetical protein